ncbi:hypothetical protein [Paenisporosarcina cavernae]|uniref:Uncharacterized protein n=1 Tax=Paenisporosarcina cavernae TaxID=2320858 RepID=A0A385YUH7_9BACL|nr:hypothetical protein [Paenisporosarcina cavernae]AYC30336.1 hypothetical protein D3873_10945 [Paenisporosarcina cavernae]
MENFELQYAVLKSVLLNFNLNIIEGYKYTYRDIAKELTNLRRNGCLSDLEGLLQVTELGHQRIKELELNKNIDYKFNILPEYKYFIEKKDLFEIYLKK